MTHAPVFYTTIASPVGDLLLTGTETHLTGLYMTPHTHGPDRRDDWVANDAPFRTVVRQLAEYFDGTRQTFDVALAPHGTTFQQRVWHALSEIPYGITVSYAHIARAIENPKGVRAVGPRKWPKPHLDYRTVPSCDRRQRITHRVWRWTASQRVASHARVYGADTPNAVSAADNSARVRAYSSTGTPCAIASHACRRLVAPAAGPIG